VHWTNGLEGKENTINRGLAHVIDVLPTCLELAGASYPDSINGQKTIAPAGKSFLPLLWDGHSIHDTLYWEHEGGRAIRIGDWKMSSLPGEPWELFHIPEDHTEMNNLSAENPLKVEEMNQAWERWARKAGINFSH
jgi:arylsulfatase